MRSNKFDDETREAIVLDYLSSLKIEAIAERYGTSNSYPVQLARKFGHPPRVNRREEWGWRRASQIGPVVA